MSTRKNGKYNVSVVTSEGGALYWNGDDYALAEEMYSEAGKDFPEHEIVLSDNLEDKSIKTTSGREYGVGGFISGVAVGIGGTLLLQSRIRQKKAGKIEHVIPRRKKNTTAKKSSKIKAPIYLKEHEMWDEGDYEYLSNKGWSNKEIKGFWDRNLKDLKQNKEKVRNMENGGEIWFLKGVGKSGLDKIKAHSKDNKNKLFIVTDDNYTNIGHFWLKNGKFAKKTVANPNYDLEKNKTTLRAKGDVIYKVKEYKSDFENGGSAYKKGGVVHLYYGGERMDETVKASSESEAEKIAMDSGAEHWEYVESYSDSGELSQRTIGNVTYKVIKDGNGYNVGVYQSGASAWKVGQPMSKSEAEKLLDSLVEQKGGSTYSNGGEILTQDEEQDFQEWIKGDNAIEVEKDVWLEQTTQHKKKFTTNELRKFFKREYLSYSKGGQVKKGKTSNWFKGELSFLNW
jgi:hypothetical protein